VRTIVARPEGGQIVTLSGFPLLIFCTSLVRRVPII